MINLQELHPEYITDASGRKKSVILSITSFQALLEDIQDLAIIAERRDEPTMPHEKLLAELIKDGLVSSQ